MMDFDHNLWYSSEITTVGSLYYLIIIIFCFFFVSHTQQALQRGPSAKTLRSPFDTQSGKMKVLNFSLLVVLIVLVSGFL